MEKTFIHRHVRAEISLSQTDSVQITYQLGVEDGESPQVVAQRVLNFGSKAFKGLLTLICLPADSKPGDEEMVLLDLEYYEMSDDGDCEGFSFTIHEVVTLKPGKGGDAVDDAASMAFKSFTKKMALLSGQPANSGGGGK